MTERVLLDAGPLVALLNSRDIAHERCTIQAATIVRPMLTTWLIIGEAAWLLRDTQQGVREIFKLIEEGLISVKDLEVTALPLIADVMDKYADLHPDLADVSLLYLSDRTGIRDVFTLDRRDFTVYRDRNGNPFNLYP